MTRPSFEVHVDTRLLYQKFISAKVGDVISYKELSDIVSRNIVGSDSNLQSAMKRAFRDDNMVFTNISKVGYKRLNDGEIVENSNNDLASIRRKAKKSAFRLSKVDDYSSLSNDQKIKHGVSASIFGAVSAFLTPKAIKAVASGVSQNGTELPVMETIKLFSREIKL